MIIFKTELNSGRDDKMNEFAESDAIAIPKTGLSRGYH